MSETCLCDETGRRAEYALRLGLEDLERHETPLLSHPQTGPGPEAPPTHQRSSADLNPGVLARAFQHLLKNFHTPKPVFEGGIVDRRDPCRRRGRKSA